MKYTEFKRSYTNTDLKSILATYHLSQTELSKLLEIPLRTVQNWCNGSRKPNEYMIKMIAYILKQEDGKMKKTRYQIESDVNGILEDIRSDYELESDFYGDCYPREVMELENRMALCNDQEDYDQMLNEVKEILLSYVVE